MKGTTKCRKAPLFIALEGIDGSGKTSLIAEIGARLNQAGMRATTTRLVSETISLLKATFDPVWGYEGAYQENISDESRGEIYAIEAYAVALRLKKTSDVDVMLFDRWFPIVGWTDKLPPWRSGMPLGLLAAQSIPPPDLVFWLDVDPSIAARRLSLQSDWMACRFDESELVQVLSALRERHGEAWSGRANVVQLDASRSVEYLVNIAVDIICGAIADRVISAD